MRDLDEIFSYSGDPMSATMDRFARAARRVTSLLPPELESVLRLGGPIALSVRVERTALEPNVSATPSVRPSTIAATRPLDPAAVVYAFAVGGTDPPCVIGACRHPSTVRWMWEGARNAGWRTYATRLAMATLGLRR